MQNKQLPVVAWVVAVVSTPFLCGRKWLNKGDEIALPVERAKKLKALAMVDYDKRDVVTDEPMPVETIRKISHAEKLARQRGQVDDTENTDDDGTGGTITATTDDDGQTFDGLGIVGKSAELLVAAGITTPAELRARIAGGLDLVSLDGIGKATAASILAALDPAE